MPVTSLEVPFSNPSYAFRTQQLFNLASACAGLHTYVFDWLVVKQLLVSLCLCWVQCLKAVKSCVAFYVFFVF